MTAETDSIRQTQAALEAIALLRSAGFMIGDDIEIETTGGGFVSLDLDLAVNETERPLQTSTDD